MVNIPYIKAFKFFNELQKIINDIPKELDKLQNESAESGKIAYTLYYLQKQKIGENPKEILNKF